MRVELLRAGGDDVEMTVKHTRRPLGSTHCCGKDGQPVVQGCVHLDVARLQPPLDEARRAVNPVGGGGVVGDEALAENALVHQPPSISAALDCLTAPTLGGACTSWCSLTGTGLTRRGAGP